MEVTSRADLWGCSFNRYGDQSTLLLIDFLVSLHILSGHTIPTINVFPWVQDWEVAFFHHISQNMQTRFAVYYLCPCAHKGIVLVLCSWPPQHHLFSRLTVIPMSNTRWFLTSVRPDLKTDALQTWTSQIFWQVFCHFWWLQEDVQCDEKPSWGQCFSTGRLSADRVATA